MKTARPPRAAAVIEDAEFLASWGVGLTAAAKRLGYCSANSLEKTLHRLGRYDLAARLRTFEPLSTHALAA
ncbi:hypothetical protein GCM10025864_44790 [Luteimicrobium album]|uniref:Transposase n=1 Tax=Luteimicrobium album TaxID=1054550 RepID=A0ABQ6I834_9MICO|nr:hypothetical protein [Luteimicrobium album]GMA22253.1 hypothetical protein GCM10025864_00120 [Luteimicrobium album]GMA26658.1 hypothetical protein GCM10025864_44170 [Luteimicrobium album]GMA26720.1 hypothetical protein GCM10025864_44790 [Luteimicrobium album]